MTLRAEPPKPLDVKVYRAELYRRGFARSWVADYEAAIRAEPLLARQEWLDIFDRTADRPIIREKVRAALGEPRP